LKEATFLNFPISLHAVCYCGATLMCHPLWRMLGRRKRARVYHYYVCDWLHSSSLQRTRCK